MNRLISKHNEKLRAGHLEMNRTREFISQNYYGPSFRANVKLHVKDCDLCLASRLVRQKSYGDL